VIGAAVILGGNLLNLKRTAAPVAGAKQLDTSLRQVSD
jgi:hypothetical protein